MKYQTYEISIVCGDSLKFIEVVACDLQAAIADVKEAYSDCVQIVQSRLV